MKKPLVICLALMAMLAFCSSLAWAYSATYTDKTLVKSTVDGWVQVVGSASHYNLFQTTVTWSGSNVTIDIKTNDNGTPAFTGDSIADLAIDLNRDGTWETGIVLKAHDGLTAGTVYTVADNTHWKISDDYSGVGGGWGTLYDPTNSTNPTTGLSVPVLLKDGTPVFTTGSVAWSSTSPYDINITLDGINTSGKWDCFDFLWATETCANDTQYDHACVPLPGAVLLLGVGLVRLTAYGRRKRALEG